MVSGPSRGIFENELLFLHSTPCFLGFSALFFREFSEFSACSPRAQRPFWTPRVPQPPCSKCCVKPGRWGHKMRKKRFLGCVGLFSGIGGGQKRQTPRFSKKMVSGPWRFSEIRPIFANFRFFSKITPKIGVFPPKIGYFRVFSGFFRGPYGPGPTRSGADPKISGNFREISGPAGTGRRPPLDPPWTPFGPPWDPFSGPTGSDLGSVWGPFGVRFGVHLDPPWDPVWGPFGVRLGPHGDPIWTLSMRLPDVVYRVYMELF